MSRSFRKLFGFSRPSVFERPGHHARESALFSRDSFSRDAMFRRTSIEILESRQVFAAPSLTTLPDLTVFQGAPVQVALDGLDLDGDALSYSVSSSNPNLVASLHTGNRSIKFHVKHVGSGAANDPSFEGDMVFELFEDYAPRTTARMIELAQSGFYNGIIFHRVINNFVIQGGDPLGTGTGGSSLPDFDDEFHPDLLHTSTGLLSMAKTSDDTNDSQFFVTEGTTRHLDFNHSIFGRLVEGEDIRQLISNVPVNASDKPISAVTIESATVFTDTQNRVLQLKAATGVTSGTSTITVDVSDGNGGTTQRTFTVTIAADPVVAGGSQDSQPYLLPIAPIQTKVNTPVTFQIPWNDVDGGNVPFFAYDGSTIDANLEVNLNSATGAITITPKNNVSGVFEIFIGVADSTKSSAGVSAFDTQSVPIYIAPGSPTIDLVASSDTGTSDTDNLTRLNNSDAGNLLNFQIGDLITGAEVKIFADGVLIGQATATGASMTVPSNGSLSLTNGAHAITVIQTLKNRAVTAGNLNTTTDLASAPSAALTLTVDSVSPAFTSTPPTVAFAGVPFAYDVQSTEEGAGGFGYVLIQGPANSSINAATGVVSWTPVVGQPGPHSFTVRASDRAGNIAEQQFSVTANSAPVIQTISDQAVVENQLLSFAVSVNDPDLPSDTLSFSLENAPQGAGINASTGVFSWTPNAAQAPGTFNITVRVTDNSGATDTQVFKVTVAEQPVAPVLNPIGDQSVDEGSVLSLTATATDDNLPNDTLNYSLLAGFPAGMTINASTGVLSWLPGEAAGPGTFTATIRVTDAFGLFDEETITITVNDVNNAPVLSAIGNQSVNAGNALTLTAVATDSDLPANTLTFSLVAGAPAGAAIDPATGVFSWTPTVGQGTGPFSITVQVSDGLLTSQQTFAVVVNVPPTIAAIVDQTVSEGSLLSLTPTFADANLPNDTLFFALIGAVPPGATINSATGAFTWTPTEAQGPGSYVFTLRATDAGGLFAEQTFNVTVQESNVAPIIGNIGTKTVAEQTTLSFNVPVSDADLPANTLTYSLGAGTPVGMAVNPTTGLVTWTPGETVGPGSFNVTVRVTDAGGLFDEATFQVVVTEANLPPTLAPIANQTVNEGVLLTLTATAADADLPANGLTFSLTGNVPTGASIHPQTGLFSWTPVESQGPAVHTITVRVTDSAGASASQSFNVTVGEVNTAPAFGNIPSQIAFPGLNFNLNAAAFDTDLPANALTYQLIDGPAGLSVNSQTGQVSWAVDFGQSPGPVSVTIQVSDAAGLSGEVTFEIVVQEFDPSILLDLIENTNFFGSPAAGSNFSNDFFNPLVQNVAFVPLLPSVADQTELLASQSTPIGASINRIQASNDSTLQDSEVESTSNKPVTGNETNSSQGDRGATRSGVIRAGFEEEAPGPYQNPFNIPPQDVGPDQLRSSTTPPGAGAATTPANNRLQGRRLPGGNPADRAALARRAVDDAVSRFSLTDERVSVFERAMAEAIETDGSIAHREPIHREPIQSETAQSELAQPQPAASLPLIATVAAAAVALPALVGHVHRSRAVVANAPLFDIRKLMQSRRRTGWLRWLRD